MFHFFKFHVCSLSMANAIPANNKPKKCLEKGIRESFDFTYNGDKAVKVSAYI